MSLTNASLVALTVLSVLILLVILSFVATDAAHNSAVSYSTTFFSYFLGFGSIAALSIFPILFCMFVFGFLRNVVVP